MNLADLRPEDALLVRACRLVLPPGEEAHLEDLLRQPLRWPWLREEAAQLRAEPLLHHHLSRPACRALVPPEALQGFERAYQRTSLKNLQIYGVLRRVLVALEEAGVPVILLKGSFLAKWVYGDIGLRPMGDIDLLCRKGDEALLWRVLAEQGATGGDDPVEKQKRKVDEHTTHAPPKYFGQISRVEVHFYLLAKHCSDPDGLQETLWADALVHDWEGLPVRSLGWEHQVLHLATHFHKHAKSSGIFLYWFTDLLEVLGRHGDALDWEKLGRLARELGLERECQEVFQLLGEPWRGGPSLVGRGLSPAKVLATTRVFRHSGIQLFRNYLATFRAGRLAGGPRERLVYGVRLVFPSWERMAFRHPRSGPLALLLWYGLDPLIRIWNLMKALARYVQPLSRH
jgi:hypothetical protein